MPVTYKQVLRILQDYSYYKNRQSGSHEVRELENGENIVVPKHTELKPGTAKAVL
jgi:predicted RNA binding protein YcfA (HicA-like mRNA interferase family)